MQRRQMVRWRLNCLLCIVCSEKLRYRKLAKLLFLTVQEDISLSFSRSQPRQAWELRGEIQLVACYLLLLYAAHTGDRWSS